ncbi:nitrilase-related carbon-nitrogen hydrolase [Aquamicrobium sp.]|uniref:nitrilase-related carbon-nitrogen hydrolase n=1 Tax=Aquamicrobium sp. TaxID=1872579 RepID=UPI0025867BEF|nr:nitrilase-related carbon-nitrogen hydrolase [Aquamicrobium sp.]MCK9550442.1 hypothetical protein [Aquamicrobium sp.]
MNKHLEKLLYFIVGISIGFIAWGHTLFLTIFAILIIFAYFFIEKRSNFFALVFGYYLASSRGLFWGTITYYNITTAGGVYLVAALLSSLAWIIFWGKTQKTKIVSFLAAQAILILPPIGLISWVNPILTAGLITPKAGSMGGVVGEIVGFGLFFILIYLMIFGLNVVKKQFYTQKTTMYIMMNCVLLLGIAYGSSTKINSNSANSEILAINSNENYETGTVSPIVDFQRQMKYLEQIENSKNALCLLPENALGYVTPANDLVWQNTNKTIFAGASFNNVDKSYSNTLTIISHGEIRPIYKQRVPVPLSMWKPWSNTGVKADIWGKGGFVHDGYEYGVLICYEQLIMLPWIQTMSQNPDVILAISNLWWAKDTNILKIQEQNIQLLASLFDKTYVFAYNL